MKPTKSEIIKDMKMLFLLEEEHEKARTVIDYGWAILDKKIKELK